MLIDATGVVGPSRRGIGPPIDDFVVELECKSPRVWRVEGAAIERFAQMTNWDYYEAALRFQKVLEASGQLLPTPHRGYSPPVHVLAFSSITGA